VFFDNLEVPVEQRIGAEGDGWSIATTVLAHERGPSDIGLVSHFFTLLDHFEDLHDELPEQRRGEFSRKIAEAFISVSACRLYILKSLSERANGIPPGPEASVCKLLMTRVEQEIGALALDLAGSEPLLGDDKDTVFHYLRSRAASIFGGTEQIQRSIVAQRVLGMQRGK
jgi:alkylation response protein AidB-like acyl-CoA dehydrogenase